eukprot:6120675-Prymnesium_polylepis.1
MCRSRYRTGAIVCHCPKLFDDRVSRTGSDFSPPVPFWIQVRPVLDRGLGALPASATPSASARFADDRLRPSPIPTSFWCSVNGWSALQPS